jgi:hypothetical protein
METIETYVAAIQAKAKAEYERLKYWMPVPIYIIATGKRFHKVIEKTTMEAKSGAVHCFVEIATGNIYKPAGWNAPAKGVRGNLQDEVRPLLCGDFYRYR